MPLPRFILSQTALLVIDVQEKLLPQIHQGDRLVRQCVKLIAGCRALGVPVIVTEQYPKGMGPTAAAVREAVGEIVIHEKLKFSACIAEVRRELSQLGVRSVLVCGMETQVCVTQTVLDLLGSGYVTGVVCDAVSSRAEEDVRIGLERLKQAGAVPVSVEMALLELVQEAGTDRFRAILPIIR